MLKFGCIAAEFAPKRKLVNFSKPKFYKKLGEFVDIDMTSWVNNLYQDKTFKTFEEYRTAYDEYIASGRTHDKVLFWRSKPMILSNDDISNFKSEIDGGAFETPLSKLFEKIQKAQNEGKVIFVYA